MFLVVGAITVLGLLTLPMNRILVHRDEILISTEATTTATAIAQEMLEEIIVRKYDRYYCATGQKASDPSVFTRYDSLGRNPGEIQDSVETFYDIDDFNGCKRTYFTPHLGNFIVTDSVYYVANGSPYAWTSVRTFLKRIDVKVYSPYLLSSDSTLTVSKIVSYRYKG